MPDWAHAPIHRFGEAGAYMVTASTLHKVHHFRTPERLELLQNHLLTLAKQYDWNLQAWAAFSNHYHWIGTKEGNSENLSEFLNQLHSDTSRIVNEMDKVEGRQVWYQYWDKALTYERSYFARLHYVIRNAVHHGLVCRETDYRWCSATWFETKARPALQRTVRSFKVDKLNVYDPFDPILG